MSIPNELHYTTVGSTTAPALLFLHGFLGSSLEWTDLMEDLSADFRCLAVDLPGHGESVGLAPEQYSLEGTAEGLNRILAEEGAEEAVVIGYSMGGRIALYLACRHPGRLRGICLESASPGLREPHEREVRREQDERLAERLEQEPFDDFLKDWYDQPLFDSLQQNPGILAERLKQRRRNRPDELARSLRGLGTGVQPSLWGELGDLSLPVCLVAGEEDRKYAGLAADMEDLCNTARVAIVPGAGHTVHAERRDTFVFVLREFLSTLE